MDAVIHHRECKSRSCGLRRRFAAVALLAVLSAGCETRSLYGIELIDAEADDSSTIVERDGYALHLSVASSPDTPGITVVAIASDVPEDPPWDWEEYQSWTAARQASAYDEYYDRKYRDLEVVHESSCPLWIETFDQRDGAREAAYGRWLHGLPHDDPQEQPKGIFVGIPVTDCESRPSTTDDPIERFTVIADGNRGDGDAVSTEIRFRVYLIDRTLKWSF